MVATKCRMCGERNAVGTAVTCVYAPDTRRQYYCFQCWDEICLRAADDVPDLMKDSDAAVQMMGVLFGVKTALKADQIESGEKLEMRADGTIATERDFDVRMLKSLIVDDIPFKRYHLTGEELEAHKAQIREKRRVR